VTKELRGYAICATPRSGSYYLCELLTSTGQLGHPFEYLNPTALELHGLPALPTDPHARLGQVLLRATTPNGVYGLKVFPAHADTMAATRWASRLPALTFVHLTREDLLGQAISLVRAVETEQWQSTRAAVRTARYSGRAIQAVLYDLALADARWRAFFSRNGIEALRLTYEDLVEDPRGAVCTLAGKLGLHDVAIDPSKLTLGIQRDAETTEWRHRFLREHHNLDYLDTPRTRSRGGMFVRGVLARFRHLARRRR
jgi:LPS sulfotransferase NodH